MEVGDIILVTCIKTGEKEERRIIGGGMGLYGDDKGGSWWSSGVQWTPNIGRNQPAPKTHTMEVIRTAVDQRQERKMKALNNAAQQIYDGTLSGAYSVENIAAIIMKVAYTELLE